MYMKKMCMTKCEERLVYLFVRNYVRYVMIYVYGIYDRCMYIDVYIYIHRKAIAHATRNTHPTYDEFSVDAQNDALDGPLNNMSN